MVLHVIACKLGFSISGELEVPSQRMEPRMRAGALVVPTPPPFFFSFANNRTDCGRRVIAVCESEEMCPASSS